MMRKGSWQKFIETGDIKDYIDYKKINRRSEEYSSEYKGDNNGVNRGNSSKNSKVSRNIKDSSRSYK